MAAFGSLEVIDKGGWRKEFALSKSLIYVGSASDNDIVLDPQHGAGVTARHLQILYLAAPGSAGLLRLINLSRTDIALDPRSPAVQAPVLRPWAAVAVGDDTRFQLGDFTLIFHLDDVSIEVPPLPTAVEPLPAADEPLLATGEPLPAAAAAETAPTVVVEEPEAAPVVATDIGLDLHLESTKLEVGRLLIGRIVVRNQGDEPAVQIKLALDGLDPGYYEMGPGPILFPNAEKEVFLRLAHSGKPSPVAGAHSIRISATAPQAYPGQKAEVSRVLQVAPFFAQELRFLEADPDAKQTLLIELYNAGNIRSRYELLAEDEDGALGYTWLLQGEPLPAADDRAPLTPDDADEERPEPAGARDALASTAAKAQATGRFATAIAGTLASLGSLLPAPAGPWLLRASEALRSNQMRAERVLNTPSSTARSLKSLLPRSLQPAYRAPAAKPAPARRRFHMGRAVPSPSCQTPFIEPGERLVLELRLKRLRSRGGQYTVRVISRLLAPAGSQVEASGVTVNKAVQVEGVAWTRLLLLAFIVLLILALALGLAYGLRQGG